MSYTFKRLYPSALEVPRFYNSTLIVAAETIPQRIAGRELILPRQMMKPKGRRYAMPYGGKTDVCCTSKNYHDSHSPMTSLLLSTISTT